MGDVCGDSGTMHGGALPLGSPHWFVFAEAFVLLAAAISCAAVMTADHIDGRFRSYAPALLVTLGVMFLPCVTGLLGSATDLVSYPVLLALWAFGVRWAIRVGRQLPRYQSILSMTCGCLAGFGYFILINSRDYATVLSPEQALVGTQNLDTLFHAAIANMLVNHGALSTGLDGFVPLKYHMLSHIWIGCLGLWLGVSTLTGYYIAAQVIAIPMLLFSLSMATYLLRRPERGITSCALIVLIPLVFLLTVDAWGWTSYSVSESYFLALIVFLLTLPLLAEIVGGPLRGVRTLEVAALSIAGILMLFSKISVGVIFWATAGFLLWRQSGLTLLSLAKLAPPILLVVAVAAAATAPHSHTYHEAIDPFNFVKDYPRGAWPNIVGNSILIYATARVWRSGLPHDKKIAEAFAVIAVASLFPALLLKVGGGSAYYFANVGTWACIVFVGAYSLPYLNSVGRPLLTSLVVLTAILLISIATKEKRKSFARLASQYGEVQSRVRALTNLETGVHMMTLERTITLLAPANPVRRAVAEGVMQTPGGRSVETLLAMGLTRRYPGAVVFVPPENSAFWGANVDCRGDPFFIPAVLGVPMLMGLSPRSRQCVRDPYYGFTAYDETAYSATSTDAQLCERAERLGFSTIFVLAAPSTGRKIGCKEKTP